MEHFDDLESLSQIKSSQDYALVFELENTLERKRNIESIDYMLVVDAWDEICSAVEALNKNNNDFIVYISNKFNVKIDDDFAISGTLNNHEKFFIRKLDEAWVDRYKVYILELNEIVLNFKIKLLGYGTADIQDEFFDSQSIISKENIKFKKSNFHGESVYLDTNSIQVLAADRKVRELISKTEVGFVYSSFLIEDAVNSNPVFLSSFLSDLKSITNGNMVGYMDEGLCYVEENVEDTISRVRKYSKLTKMYEKTTMNDVIQHFHLYPALRKGKELNKTISDDVIGYFKSEDKKDVSTFNQIKIKFSNTIISEFIQSGDIGVVDDFRGCIEQLSNLFDFVNFQTEHAKFANFNKIASSYRDRMHLEHAYICDYFVSEDVRLRNRAQIIFEILGVKTKAISINNLKSYLKNSASK